MSASCSILISAAFLSAVALFSDEPLEPEDLVSTVGISLGEGLITGLTAKYISPRFFADKLAFSSLTQIQRHATAVRFANSVYIKSSS